MLPVAVGRHAEGRVGHGGDVEECREQKLKDAACQYTLSYSSAGEIWMREDDGTDEDGPGLPEALLLNAIGIAVPPPDGHRDAEGVEGAGNVVYVVEGGREGVHPGRAIRLPVIGAEEPAPAPPLRCTQTGVHGCFPWLK